MNFTGKVVLITSASSGIGAGTAAYFAKLGATLALTGRTADKLKISAKNLARPEGVPEPLEIVADPTLEEDAVRIIDETIQHFGKLDILINNAGILERGTIETTTLEQYDFVMLTNVRSVYHLTMLATPHLIKSHGNIVNLSSVAGLRAFVGVLSYCMSKSAIDQFTRCIALELAPMGVRVNSVNPGVIVTSHNNHGGLDEEAYQQFVERSKTTHPLGRTGNVDDVAASIAFLASDMASFITGVQLAIDGGRHALCPR